MDKIEQSKMATQKHQAEVKAQIKKLTSLMADRGETHDNSKLVAPEIEVFAEHTPMLHALEYRSPAYEQSLANIQVALKHHYAVNRHHPEHYKDGLAGMNLVDLIELIADWKASSLRQDDGNLLISIQKNQEKYGYSDDLASVLYNTATLLDLL